MIMGIASQKAIWFSVEKVSLSFRFSDFANMDNSIRILVLFGGLMYFFTDSEP